jgi:hypothetical protein
VVPERHQENLRDQGFTLTSEDEIGLPGLHDRVLALFFSDAVLPPASDVGGSPKNRYQRKDLMHYRWRDAWVTVRSTSDDRYARVGPHQAPRFHWLTVQGGLELAIALLSLVPPEQRNREGTIGMHCFRSSSKAAVPPQVGVFDVGGVYFVSRSGSGAYSYLCDLRKGGAEVLRRQLVPGEILLFRQRFAGQSLQFMHGVTSLEGDGPQCDTVVVQIDAPEDLAAAAEERRDRTDIWSSLAGQRIWSDRWREP